MMTMMAILIFGGALGLACYALATTLGPNAARIVEILYARPQPRFEPLAALVRAERRIAVRRWAAPASRPAYSYREAA